MRPEETSKNYKSDRRMYANYVARNVKKVCKEVGPRPSGTEDELRAEEMLAEDLKTSCDEVKIESFKLSPAAFMAWVQILVCFGLASVVCLVLTHFIGALSLVFTIIPAALLVLGVFIIVMEFLFYQEILDPFFPKKESHNVVAVRKASGETKRRIIFSGHADSAPEWNFTYWGGPKLVLPSIILGLASVVYLLVVSIIGLVKAAGGANLADDKTMWILTIVAICISPIILWDILFYNPHKFVEGANDNLTGCLCSMALPRYMADHDIRFENTEVMIVLTGSEEAGLRGAKAFAKAHKAEFDAEEGIETIYCGLDTIRDFDFMGVYNKDMTGTVTHDAKVANLIKEGAKLAGYDLPYMTVTFGSSDAAAITKAGMKAAALCAMDPAPARYYHTRLDTADNLDLKTIEAGVGIVLETAFLYDEKGLDL